MGHLILVLIVNHQHIVIVTPRLKPLEMLFLVVDQLGANVPNKVDQHILLHGLADVLVLAVEESMPVISPDEEALAVSTCFVEELGSHFEGHAESAHAAPVLVLDRKDLLLIYLESDRDISCLDKVDFSKFI